MQLKTFFAALLAVTLLSSSALAMTCTYSQMDSDDYVKIVLNESTIEVQLYESSFELSEDQYATTLDGEYVLINPSGAVNISGEGEIWAASVSGLIKFEGMSAVLNLKIDGTQVADAKRMNCAL